MVWERLTGFDRERVATLRAFGLSEYASRAYLALLELGTTEARDVSRLAKIPLAKVYSTLDQLQERGLVAVQPGPPKRFTPSPFSAFLQRKRARLGIEMQELELAEKTVPDLFPLRGNATADDRGTFLTLRGRESVVEKFVALAAGTREDILLLTADGFARRGNVQPVIAEAAARGVAVRALVRIDEETLPTLEKLAGNASLRAKEPSADRPADVAIAVFDSRQLMIIHFVPDDASRYEGKDVAIVAGEGAMVRALRSTLEAMWQDAEPFEHAVARLRSKLPRTRTVVFHDIESLVADWRATLDAATSTHLIVSTHLASGLTPRTLDAMRRAAERGVRQRAIVPIDTPEGLRALREALGPNGEIRDPPPGALQRVSMMDERDLYFGPSRFDPRRVRLESLTIRTNDPGALRLMREYFDELWSASRPV